MVLLLGAFPRISFLHFSHTVFPNAREAGKQGRIGQGLA